MLQIQLDDNNNNNNNNTSHRKIIMIYEQCQLGKQLNGFF